VGEGRGEGEVVVIPAKAGIQNVVVITFRLNRYRGAFILSPVSAQTV